MPDFPLSKIAALIGSHPIVSQAIGTAAIVVGLQLSYIISRHYIRRLVSDPVVRQRYWGYSFNVHILIGFVLILGVWLEELKTISILLTGMAAAILIVFKEMFLGFAGRFSLAAASHYEIGDRILINGICGDVINIGLLNTWVLESAGEEGTGESTGSVVLIPHIWLIQHALINLTHVHDFIWDEIKLAFPVNADSARIEACMTGVASEFVAGEQSRVQRAIRRLERSYAVTSSSPHPQTFSHIVMSASGVQYLEMCLTYPVDARAKRKVHSKLTTELLAALRREGLLLFTKDPLPVAEGCAENDTAETAPTSRYG